MTPYALAATYANKETQISLEDDPEKRRMSKTIEMLLQDNPHQNHLDY